MAMTALSNTTDRNSVYSRAGKVEHQKCTGNEHEKAIFDTDQFKSISLVNPSFSLCVCLLVGLCWPGAHRCQYEGSAGPRSHWWDGNVWGPASTPSQHRGLLSQAMSEGGRRGCREGRKGSEASTKRESDKGIGENVERSDGRNPGFSGKCDVQYVSES